MMDSKLTRGLTVACIIAIIATIASGIYTFITLQGNKLSTVSPPVLYNVAWADRADDDSLRYYTGNAFVRYEIHSKKHTLLGNKEAFGNAYDIRWLKNGVVFQATTTDPHQATWEPFQAYLASGGETEDGYGINPNDSMYWFYSFDTSALIPLGAHVGSSFEFGTPTSEGGFLYDSKVGYRLIDATGKITEQYAPHFADEAQIVEVKDGYISYVVANGDNVSLKRYDLSAKTSATLVDKLYENDGHSLYEPIIVRDKVVIYQETKAGDTMGTVWRFDSASQSKQELASQFFGEIKAQTNGDVALLHIGRDILRMSYVNERGEITTARSIFAPNSTPVAAYAFGEDFYYIESTGKLFQVGPPDTIKVVKAGYSQPLETGYNDDSSALSRNIEGPSDNSYTLTVVNGSVREAYNRLAQYVKSKNLSPYEFTFLINAGPKTTN